MTSSTPSFGQDPSGKMKALQVDNAGNLKTSVTGAGSGGTSSVDESVFASGVAAGTPAMGVVNPSDTPTTGTMAVVALDAARNLKVNVVAGGGAGGTSSSFGAAVPATGTAAGFQSSTGNLAPGLLDASGNLKVNVAAGGSGGGAVTVADGANVVEGTTTDAAVTTDVSGTLSAKLRGIIVVLQKMFALSTPVRVDPTGGTAQPVTGTVTANAGTNLNTSALALESGGHLASLDTKLPAQGQALSSASIPVVLPATQITTLTPPAAITGFATSAKQDTGNTSVASIDTKTPALGQALAASSVPVVLTAIQAAALAPPAAITGFALETGGNLAAIKADVDKIPSQGQALSAASMPVVLPAAQITTLTPPSSVTVTQGTGTNLHAVIDSGSTTAVTQATGTNLHTVVDSGTVTTITNVVHVDDNAGSLTIDQATASNLNAQVVGAVASAGANAGNPVKTGAVFNTTQPTVTTGQIVDVQSTARGALIVATGTDTFNVSVNSALPAGSAVIGHVIADSGSTTAVTGNVTAVQATGTNLHTVVDSGAITATLNAETTKVIGTVNVSAGQTIGITANSSVNVAQINGVAPLMGNGVTGTGSQRVTIASDNTAFSVNSTLSAETTKVIGVVRVADGSGNLITSTTSGLDANVRSINGVVPLMGNGVTGTGSQRVTIASDNTAFSVNATLSAETTKVIGTVNVAASQSIAANVTPVTSGGLTVYHLVSAASTNATVVKASAGQLYGWYIYNSNAAARKLAFHNASATPTAGAAIFFAIVIPPSSAANVEFTCGIAFSTGISITTVTDLTDAGATAVAASDLIINLFYK